MKNQYNLPCNIAQTLNIIGDKWSLLILHKLLMGHETFKELQEGLEGIPTNLLSNRLKSLESDNLIESTLYQEHPPRYKYSLTQSGNDLTDVFNSLIMWGEKHLKQCHKKIIHKECGHSVVQQYYCPHCESVIGSDEMMVKKEDTLL